MAAPLTVIDTPIHLNKCYSGGLPNQWVQEWCEDWSQEAHKDYAEGKQRNHEQSLPQLHQSSREVHTSQQFLARRRQRLQVRRLLLSAGC